MHRETTERAGDREKEREREEWRGWSGLRSISSAISCSRSSTPRLAAHSPQRLLSSPPSTPARKVRRRRDCRLRCGGASRGHTISAIIQHQHGPVRARRERTAEPRDHEQLRQRTSTGTETEDAERRAPVAEGRQQGASCGARPSAFLAQAPVQVHCLCPCAQVEPGAARSHARGQRTHSLQSSPATGLRTQLWPTHSLLPPLSSLLPVSVTLSQLPAQQHRPRSSPSLPP